MSADATTSETRPFSRHEQDLPDFLDRATAPEALLGPIEGVLSAPIGQSEVFVTAC